MSCAKMTEGRLDTLSQVTGDRPVIRPCDMLHVARQIFVWTRSQRSACDGQSEDVATVAGRRTDALRHARQLIVTFVGTLSLSFAPFRI